MTHAADPPVPKAGWPLMAMALAAFLPGAGFILGSIAVTWALISQRPRALLAAVVAAAGAFGNLVVILVLLPVYSARVNGESRTTATQRDLIRVVFELERYRGTRGSYPATLPELVAPGAPTNRVRILDVASGRRPAPLYQYRLRPDGQSYDLFSVGPDGRLGTADDIRPPLVDSLRKETGYLPGP